MADQFQEVEETFGRLKELFNDRKISQREFIDTLKQLRIKDEDGRFWMIGAQSGKWYYFDGDEWVQAKPPSLRERRAICIHCGYENNLEAEVCARCGGRKPGEAPGLVCPDCGTRLEDPSRPCPVCRPAEDKPAAAISFSYSYGDERTDRGDWNVHITGVHPRSFFWFFGVLGLFAGLLFGLLAGVTSLFPGFVAGLPAFFAEIQGKLAGGLIFTVLGGAFGFAALGVSGLLSAAVANGILSLTGGIRARAEKAERTGKD